MKRMVIIIGIVFLAGAVFLLIMLRIKTPSSKKLVQQGNGQPQSFPLAPAAKAPTSTSAELPTSTSAEFLKYGNFPDGDTIDIGTNYGSVKVKNFYKHIIDTEEGRVIMRDADKYTISYDTETSYFNIVIFGEPAADIQKMAESDFLNILNISQADACKLNVYVIETGENIYTTENISNLSFCANSVK